MIVLVGNSPSSGSSFFSELLDSSDVSVCGEEIGIFSNKRIYDFDTYKQDIFKGSSVSSIYSKTGNTQFNWLYTYGLNTESYVEMVNNSETISDFSDRLSTYYLSLRGKNSKGVFFEKTPENISCLNDFLDAFPDSYFISIVRNPLYVFDSLIRRGYSDYMASGIWLVDVAKLLKYRANSRVIIVKYEDLVDSPYTIVSNILEKITTVKKEPSEIEKFHHSNEYKRSVSIRMGAWKIKKYGTIKNANYGITEEIRKRFYRSLEMRISKGYARLFDLEAIDYKYAITAFGYTELLDNAPELTGGVKKCFYDNKRLYYKWKSDLKRGEALLRDVSSYLNPIEKKK